MLKAKKIFLAPFLIALFGVALFSISFFTKVSITKGQDVASSTPKELLNYAWSESLGWISFNCRNDNYCPTSDYKVQVDGSGLLSGYAWNDQVGWISFNQSDLNGCPSGTCSAKVENFATPFTSVKSITGWAKILSDNSWIHLSNNSYGIMLHSDGSISGYAWSEDYGWISFEGELYGVNIEGIYTLFPMTLKGNGFVNGTTVSLIPKETTGTSIAAIPCQDQNGANTFTASSDGTTLTGSCPLYKADYGKYDIKVITPDGQSATLSASTSTASTTLFTIMPPTEQDLTVLTSATSAGNTGTISIEKIISKNSLMGASVGLTNNYKTVHCFTIHEYDNTAGWIPGKDANGNILPMTCDLNDTTAGNWQIVISKVENGQEKWRDLTSASLAVSCVSKSWDLSYTDKDAPNLYGNVTLTDNCGNHKTIHGTCTPVWTPTTSCIYDFKQTANNCLNKPTRNSSKAGIYGSLCGSGYKCQANQYGANYGTCIVDPTQCTKDFACAGLGCGTGTDLCGHSHTCKNTCSWSEDCQNNKCVSKY